MITILHNPRCSKSREGLSLLENSGKDFGVIKYLDEPISESALKNIISLLKIKPIELVRKNEAIWKSDFKGITLSDAQIIKAMVRHPKLIERPIVINSKKAAIGRPPQNILNII
ncbi:arsenate reductase (glutaredoxin) [Psychroserpens burtonensis]|uniref:Arsenate reductase (Glutaredoxin) n=1 Tax=Psychroserpens burtonensis TaxID=49278 RepID=A0A5C7B9J6_9FLAO|nr:arsenate reductase (glutaredoxin) [Psychroserpens burtonensis]TXE17290.1 arsenate reductase (glutaredoxin) [Psychroserpens burtonensis]